MALTLVLLPGMDGTGDLFTPFVTALGPAQAVSIVRYPTAHTGGYAELMAFARAALPAEGPVVILGESFSGPLAVSLAQACGPRVRGLIFCCSFVRNPRPGLSVLRALIGALPIAQAPLGLVSRVLLGRFATPVLCTALEQAMRQVSPAALRARLRAVLGADVSAALATLKLPTLYLRATRDHLVPPAASDLILQLAPHAMRVDIDAPHFLLQARPGDAARVVSGFLRGLA